MKKILVLITGLFILFSVMTAWFLFAIPEIPEATDALLAEVKTRDIAIQVRTLGTLEAEKAHMISSQIKGPGAKIILLAQNGRFVAKGEVLVRFDPQPYEEAVADLSSQVEHLEAAVKAAEQLVEWEKNEAAQRIITAEYQYKVAQLDLKRLIEGEGPLKVAQYKDELDKAQLELTNHKAYQADLEALEQEGIANPAELDRVREHVKILQDKQGSAKRQYDSYEKYVLPVLVESGRAKEQNTALAVEQVKQASVHKIANAEATLQQARGKLKSVRLALDKAQGELGKTEIRAPFDGLIIHYETYRDGEMRTPREGDTVIINQPIMYFPDISSLMVKSRVREIDLHRIKVGQPATVIVDAYPEETFSAQLSFIGALAKKGTNSAAEEKYFQVMFALQGGDNRLRPGMSARIVVHVAELNGVPALPIQSVFQDSGGDYCYLYNGTMYEKRYVTLGGQNENFAEVKSGLSIGDQVSQIHPDALR